MTVAASWSKVRSETNTMPSPVATRIATCGVAYRGCTRANCRNSRPSCAMAHSTREPVSIEPFSDPIVAHIPPAPGGAPPGPPTHRAGDTGGEGGEMGWLLGGDHAEVGDVREE